MLVHNFVRAAAASPVLRVADPDFNVAQVRATLRDAERLGVHLLVFPELCLTGYTCADLFQQATLLRAATAALQTLLDHDDFGGLYVVGLPLAVDDQVFNAAAVIHGRRLLGVVPKSFMPNYKEFYEGRWFSPAATARTRAITLAGQEVPFGADLLFTAADVEGLIVGVEICEDLWVPI